MQPNNNAILMGQFSTIVKDMEPKGFILCDTKVHEDQVGNITSVDGVFIYGMFEIIMTLNFVESE